MVYVKCINDMIKLVDEKGVKVAILILTKAKTSYVPLTSSIQTVWVELPEVGLDIGNDGEVQSQQPLEEAKGFCPLPDLGTFDDLSEEDLSNLLGTKISVPVSHSAT